MRRLLLAAIVVSGLACCAPVRSPGLTPPAAAAAVERYYDSCHESYQLAQCVSINPLVVPWGGSPYLNPAFRWLRVEVLPGQARTSSMFTPAPLRLIVPTAEGVEHLFDSVTDAPTTNWQGGLWSYAPTTATIQKIRYNANADDYVVDSTIAFAPIPWFAAFINACRLCASGGGDVDPRQIEVRLASVNGHTAQVYVWRSGGNWVAGAQPPGSPIGSFFEFVLIIVLTPVFLAALYLMRRHAGDVGKSGPGPTFGYSDMGGKNE